jgi:hypothetical protein
MSEAEAKAKGSLADHGRNAPHNNPEFRIYFPLARK